MPDLCWHAVTEMAELACPEVKASASPCCPHNLTLPMPC